MLLNKSCSPFQKRIWGLRAWLNHKGHNWKQQIAAANEASSIFVLKWESERLKLGNGLPSSIRKGGSISLECACTEVPAGCRTPSLSMKHSHAADCYYRKMHWNRAIMLQHIPFWSASQHHLQNDCSEHLQQELISSFCLKRKKGSSGNSFLGFIQ